MKKVFFAVSIFATSILQESFAEDTSTQTQSQLSQFLTSCYIIKDVLVAGNTNAVSTSADE
ncbi:MAG: hypothetical protein M3139_16780 [Bacteroidota bacterium]|nr:hypothetical protein [Bacteroidota bacterium]